MIYERIKLQLGGRPDIPKNCGYFELEHYAYPHSVRITIFGRQIIPERFTILGEPILSEELTLMLKAEEALVRMNSSARNYEITAEIRYQNGKLLSNSSFDSCTALKNSLISLSAFHKLIDYRQIWYKINNSKQKLTPFVVLGKYLLDETGKVFEIERNVAHKKFFSDICTLKYFNSIVSDYTLKDVIIPSESMRCPCCGKSFSLYDLRYSSFAMINNKIVHKSCSDEYFRLRALSEEISSK